MKALLRWRFRLIGATVVVLVVCGCGSAPATWADQPLIVEPERLADLAYATFVTDGPAREGLPLLVVLHSMAAGPEEFAPLFARLSVPARVLLPQGPVRSHGGFAWWPASAYASPASDVRAIEESTALLARFIAAAQTRYRATGSTVVTGNSQGGDLSFALALRYPDRIHAALPLAGRIPPPLWPQSPIAPAPPIDAFHGKADSKAPYARTEMAVNALTARGLPIVLHGYDGLDHETSPAQEGDVLACAERRLRGDLAPSACGGSRR